MSATERGRGMTNVMLLDDIADPVNPEMYYRAREEILRRLAAARLEGGEVVAETKAHVEARDPRRPQGDKVLLVPYEMSYDGDEEVGTEIPVTLVRRREGGGDE